MSKPQKVGIFSGTFDPVHRGHIESCVVAMGALELNTVLILLEKQPRRKQDVADFNDRANMLELATMDFPSLQLVDLETTNITTDDTLRYLHQRFSGGEYWYIVGSDMLKHIKDWAGHEALFANMNLCVVLRDDSELEDTDQQLKRLHKEYPDTVFTILPSVWSPVSSSSVKQSLRNGEVVTGVDPAVQEYIHKHGLYGVQ